MALLLASGDRTGVFANMIGSRPGCAYLITSWYVRFEVGKRLSAFWIVSVIAGGFSAIFAYVLSLLRGKGGLNGWSCTFSHLDSL